MTTTKTSFTCQRCHGHGEINIADEERRECFVGCPVCYGEEYVSVHVGASRIDDEAFAVVYVAGAPEILGDILSELGHRWESYLATDGTVVVERRAGTLSVSDALDRLDLADLAAPLCVCRDRSGIESPFAVRVAS